MTETIKKRRPGRAIVYGLIWGLGLALWLIVGQPIIGLDDLGSVVAKVAVVVAGAVLVSLLWAYLGPALKPKGPPPSTEPPASGG